MPRASGRCRSCRRSSASSPRRPAPSSATSCTGWPTVSRGGCCSGRCWCRAARRRRRSPRRSTASTGWRRAAGAAAGRADRRPRRRQSRRPVGVQRGDRRARRGAQRHPGDLRGRPRDRYDADRFRRRPARADADRRGRDGGAGARSSWRQRLLGLRTRLAGGAIADDRGAARPAAGRGAGAAEAAGAARHRPAAPRRLERAAGPQPGRRDRAAPAAPRPHRRRRLAAPAPRIAHAAQPAAAERRALDAALRVGAGAAAEPAASCRSAARQLLLSEGLERGFAIVHDARGSVVTRWRRCGRASPSPSGSPTAPRPPPSTADVRQRDPPPGPRAGTTAARGRCFSFDSARY